MCVGCSCTSLLAWSLTTAVGTHRRAGGPGNHHLAHQAPEKGWSSEQWQGGLWLGPHPARSGVEETGRRQPMSGWPEQHRVPAACRRFATAQAAGGGPPSPPPAVTSAPVRIPETVAWYSLISAGPAVVPFCALHDVTFRTAVKCCAFSCSRRQSSTPCRGGRQHSMSSR